MRTLSRRSIALVEATQRDIAEIVFRLDASPGSGTLTASSPAQARRLIRRGRAFMYGEYRGLVMVSQPQAKGAKSQLAALDLTLTWRSARVGTPVEMAAVPMH